MTLFEQIDAYILHLIRTSTPEQTRWNIERIREGIPTSWNYIDGCMLTALLAMADITGDRLYFDFA